jgi:hypothetical protein
MQSLEVPQPDAKPQSPTLGSLEALAGLTSAPPQWAGAGSSIHLLPLSQDGLDLAPKIFQAPFQLAAPSNSRLAVCNILVDWAFGVRILRVFGTGEAEAATKHSGLEFMSRKRKRPAGENA